jgi:hypothetical protein
MNNLSVVETSSIPAMSNTAIDKVNRFHDELIKRPQGTVHTNHILHGGTYVRTIWMAAGFVMTSALIKIPTTLIVQGDVAIFVGEDNPLELSGYNVLPASAGRKVVIVSRSDAYLTMLFPTDVGTLAEAEAQFTDEADLLMSSHDGSANDILITGE